MWVASVLQPSLWSQCKQTSIANYTSNLISSSYKKSINTTFNSSKTFQTKILKSVGRLGQKIAENFVNCLTLRHNIFT